MKKHRRRICAAAAVCFFAAFPLAACGQSDDAGDVKEYPAESLEAAAGQGQAVFAESIADLDDMFTDRDLSGIVNAAESSEITLEGSGITISEAGTYILSGPVSEGTLLIDADKDAKIQLVLKGVEISNSAGAAIYVRQADKVFLTLVEGSVNTLSNGGAYRKIDDNNIDGVIFSKADLTINGSGSLNIDAAAGHGIVSKDDLKVTGGTVTVQAAGHGLSGKDSVCVADGILQITSGRDGIHAENNDEAEKGFVCIAGGSITVESGGDCVSAGSYLQIEDGIFNLAAGGGSAVKTAARNGDGDVVSTKGLKSGGQLLVRGGAFNIDAQDDALHSDDSLTIAGGAFQIATGDDGLHADETLSIGEGDIEIFASYEGIEGKNIVISGGNIRLYASDDGINAAGGNDGSDFGGMGEAGDYSVLISGGRIFINADGDGIDSNGDLTVTGGQAYISGPEDEGNGALDYNGEGKITGGTVVAVGHSAMAMNFGEDSTQGSILIGTSACGSGTEVSLRDESGSMLASYTAESSFNSVLVSCPELAVGGTYKITVGEQDYEVTLENMIYGGSQGFGGGQGRPGGHESSGGDQGGFGGPGGAGRSPDGADVPELPEGSPDGAEFPEDFQGIPGEPGEPGNRGNGGGIPPGGR